MNLRKLLFPALSLPTVALAFVIASPSVAQAAEAMCANEYGSCHISNDGQSFISCSCDDSGGDEGTGGDEFFGLSEVELEEVCWDHLADCEPFEDEGGEGTSTTSDTGDDWGEEESGEESTESGEEGTTIGESSTTDEGEGEGEGEESTTTDGEGEGEGEGEESTTTDSGGEGDESTTTDGEGEGEGEGEESTTTDSGEGPGEGGDEAPGEGGDEAPGEGDSGDGPNQSETSEGGSETGGAGAEGGGDGAQGCSVTPHASGLGLLMLSMLGLVGLRRREDA